MNNEKNDKIKVITKTKISLTTKILIILGLLTFTSAMAVGIISLVAQRLGQ